MSDELIERVSEFCAKHTLRFGEGGSFFSVGAVMDVSVEKDGPRFIDANAEGKPEVRLHPDDFERIREYVLRRVA